MSLKAVVDSLDDVDEKYHDLYAEKDGVFVLGVEGVESHPSVKALAVALDRQKKEVKELKAERSDLKASVEAFGDLTPEELEELRTKAAGGGDKAPTPEELDALVEKRYATARKQLEGRITALEGENTNLKTEKEKVAGELTEIKIFSAIEAAAVEAGARPKALKDIKARASGVWRLGEDGKPAAFNGDEPMMGAHGPVTMDEWVVGLKEDADYLFQPNNGGGAQGGNQKGNGSVVLSATSDNVIGNNLEKIASGEVTVR